MRGLLNFLGGAWFSGYWLAGAACKEVVSDSPGLVDFAIGLVNSVLNLPDGQDCWLKYVANIVFCSLFYENLSDEKLPEMKRTFLFFWNLKALVTCNKMNHKFGLILYVRLIVMSWEYPINLSIPLVYSCVPLYTHVYPLIPLNTLVYPCIPLYSHVYPCTSQHTLVYLCIPL